MRGEPLPGGRRQELIGAITSFLAGRGLDFSFHGDEVAVGAVSVGLSAFDTNFDAALKHLWALVEESTDGDAGSGAVARVQPAASWPPKYRLDIAEKSS